MIIFKEPIFLKKIFPNHLINRMCLSFETKSNVCLSKYRNVQETNIIGKCLRFQPHLFINLAHKG